MFQPDELTFIVEVSNLVFTGIFGFEMCLKILAEGVYGYISSGYNVFDGVIVVLRYVDTSLISKHVYHKVCKS